MKHYPLFGVWCRQLSQSPDCLTTRLVFADWLEEQTDNPRFVKAAHTIRRVIEQPSVIPTIRAAINLAGRPLLPYAIYRCVRAQVNALELHTYGLWPVPTIGPRAQSMRERAREEIGFFALTLQLPGTLAPIRQVRECGLYWSVWDAVQGYCSSLPYGGSQGHREELYLRLAQVSTAFPAAIPQASNA